MNEEREASNESTRPTDATPQVQVSQPLGTLPKQPTAAQQLEKVEREMNTFERSTLRWTK